MLYKVLNVDGSCCKGGKGKWFLPKNGRPGKWMLKIDNLEACSRGYHLVNIDQLIEWLGPAIWEAEGRGEHIDLSNKSVWSQARLVRATKWNAKTARLFAADCAEHVLHFFEKERTDDKRPRLAIKAARDFAEGKIAAAAMAAAGAAAGAETWDAAMAAAWDAAMAAAWDAAMAAAGAEAGAAARDAAMAAAGAAAGAVARDAAMAEAGAVARDAAMAAAFHAEHKWQTELLKSIL